MKGAETVEFFRKSDLAYFRGNFNGAFMDGRRAFALRHYNSNTFRRAML